MQQVLFAPPDKKFLYCVFLLFHIYTITNPSILTNTQDFAHREALVINWRCSGMWSVRLLWQIGTDQLCWAWGFSDKLALFTFVEREAVVTNWHCSALLNLRVYWQTGTGHILFQFLICDTNSYRDTEHQCTYLWYWLYTTLSHPVDIENFKLHRCFKFVTISLSSREWIFGPWPCLRLNNTSTFRRLCQPPSSGGTEKGRIYCLWTGRKSKGWRDAVRL